MVTCEQIEYHMPPNCPNPNGQRIHSIQIQPNIAPQKKENTTTTKHQGHRPYSVFIHSQNPMCHSIIRPLLSENSHDTTAKKMINRTRYKKLTTMGRADPKNNSSIVQEDTLIKQYV